MDYSKLSIKELNNLLISKKTSAFELAKYFYDLSIEAQNKLNCYITILPKEQILAKAKEIDEIGDFSNPLTGIPFSLKDNISTKGIQTTCGTRILEGYIPTFDAHITQMLLDAGGILIAKNNLDELASGSKNLTSG
jgi:aspartyl-tRNA(Asn)/glutamyl-tRNA(Gln) amidotransferase subunit A